MVTALLSDGLFPRAPQFTLMHLPCSPPARAGCWGACTYHATRLPPCPRMVRHICSGSHSAHLKGRPEAQRIQVSYLKPSTQLVKDSTKYRQGHLTLRPQSHPHFSCRVPSSRAHGCSEGLSWTYSLYSTHVQRSLESPYKTTNTPL